MTTEMTPYPIGTPGEPWTDSHKQQWRAAQRKQRGYAEDVLGVVERLRGRFDVSQYGELDYGVDGRFPLYALRSKDWDAPSCHRDGTVPSARFVTMA